MKYLIYSTVNGDWWRPAYNGFATDSVDAGLYDDFVAKDLKKRFSNTMEIVLPRDVAAFEKKMKLLKTAVTA